MKQAPPLKLTFQLKPTGNNHTVFLRLNFRVKIDSQKYDAESKSYGKREIKYFSSYVSTGIKASPKDWNKKSRRLKKDSHPDNILLSNIERLTKDVYAKYATTIERNSPMKKEYLTEAIKKLVFGKEIPEHKIIIRKEHNKIDVIDQRQINFDSKHVFNRYAHLPHITGDSVHILNNIDESTAGAEKRVKLLTTPFNEYVNTIRKQRYERKEISNNTYRQYVNLASFIDDYAKEKSIKSEIKYINEKWVMDFLTWARSRKQENGESYSYNYINETMQKLLKSMCNWLKTYDKIDLKISWQIKSLQKSKEKTQEIALTLPQLKKIIDLKLPEKANHSKIELARDIFIIGCLTGLRVSDLMVLNLEENVDGSYSVNQILQKTGTQVNYNVHDKVVEIWKKYNGKIPKLSEPKLNQNIKKLGEKAGFTQMISFKRKDPANPKLILESKPEPFFNLIKSSSCRRTFASWAVHSQSISLDMICKVTGHSKISQLMEYCKVNDSELNVNLNKLYKGIEL